MCSGKPLTQEIVDVLFENAHDMIDCRNRKQLIQYGHKYDGVIESNLEPIDFNGFEVISFQAELVFQPVGYTKVDYGIRTTDLENMQKAQWMLGSFNEKH